jgi:hypothetical protein
MVMNTPTSSSSTSRNPNTISAPGEQYVHQLRQ